MMKKIRLMIALVVGLLCLAVFACAGAEVIGGNCGDQESDVRWQLDTETGVMTISGTGKMRAFGFNNTPWNEQRANIRRVIIGTGVTSIGGDAFCNCSNLSSISIPQSVTSISDFAFGDCTSLTNISIPQGVTFIGEDAFVGCTSLSNVSIPQSVTSIGKRAFSVCNSLTSIDIPQNITSISTQMFSGCTSLTSISIPQGVTSIGSYAFQNCTNLTSISIPQGVTSIEDGAFDGCTSLTSISIPQGVTSIGSYAFLACYSLANVSIPQGVTSIGDGAFDGCTSLTSIFIPQSVTSIGSSAFQDCTSLTSISIPQGVTSIGSETFADCTSLISISMPQGVTSIGNSAFENCTSLTNISIPQGVTSIGYRAFQDCFSLASISIPQSVTSISICAFRNCTSLSNVSIPQNVTSIGEQAFRNCTGLTSISIPQGVTSIGKDAFAYRSTSDLYKILIPDSVTRFESGCLGQSYNTTIYCNRYSPAHIYAEGNGYKVVFLDDVSFQDIASVSLAGCDPFIAVNTSRTLTPNIFPLLDDLSITWQSSAPGVISVDEKGTVTAHKNGKATITVSVNGVKATFKMTAYTPIESFTLPEYAFLMRGTSITLPVENLRPADADEPIIWTSSYDSVAQVDSTGNVTTRAVGEANIIATTRGGVTRVTHVVVSKGPTALRLADSAVTTEAGDTLQLTALITIGGKEYENPFGVVTFKSSNPAVATVNDFGQVTGVAPGSATVTVTAGTLKGTCQVTVTPRRRLVLPEDIRVIEANAFAGSGIVRVEIPGLVTDIGSGAFAGCTELVQVEFLGNPDIAQDAFDGCPNVIFLCDALSKPAAWAEAHGIPWEQN